MNFSPLVRAALLACLVLTSMARADQIMFVGTYTGAKSKGIYSFRMTEEGKLTPLGLAAETANPTYLAVHPNKKFLYAINEVSIFGGAKAGSVTAYTIDAANGRLTQLNSQSAGGTGPCHVSLDRKGRVALVANYGGGSVKSLPIRPDGTLGEPGTFIQHTGSSVDKSRQEGPHGHAMIADPSQKFALACDLGLDQVLVYRLDLAQGTLTPHQPPFATLPPGSGPRHIDFHPNGRFAYVINEMLCTMSVFSWDSRRGELKEIQNISTLPGPWEKGFSTAEVYVHPSGRFVYGSNRGHHSIVVYACDPRTGKLTAVQHESTQGKTPRHFALAPGGRLLLAENQDSGTIVVFKIDPKTGRLTPTGEKVEVPAPVCAVFVPARK